MCRPFKYFVKQIQTCCVLYIAKLILANVSKYFAKLSQTYCAPYFAN